MDEQPPVKTADIATNPSNGMPEQPVGMPLPPPPENTPQPSPPPAAVKKSRKRLLWIILILLLLIAAAAASYVKLTGKTVTKPPISHSARTAQTKQPSGQYVFLNTPKQLGNLNFFADLGAEFGTSCSDPNQTTNCPPAISASDISYYQIGTTASNQPIVVAADYGAGEQSFAYLAIEPTSGHYNVLAQLSYLGSAANTDASQQQATFSKSLSSTVSLDTTTTIPDLTFPDSVSIGGATLTVPTDFSPPYGSFIKGLSSIRGSYFNTTVPASDLHKLGQTDGKTYYRVVAQDSANYQVDELYGTVGGVYAADYTLPDALTADTPAITWSQGNNTTASYTSRPQGCGSATGFVVAKNIDSAQLTQVGTGPNGQALYELPTDSPLFQEVYNTDYGNGSNTGDASLENLSADQFQADHGVFLAKNALGDYQVYLRSDMIVTGGCGKPVIYLYPQRPTDVNVQVGAQVTKSDPHYTAQGWQNVLALPGSRLLYQGSGYPYLYWEGTGLGSYPTINFGTVVPRGQVVSTIKSQLAAQGFTPSEIQDFLAYWQPRLPNTPYVRLSWLSTRQLNQLAPLQISPRPTTLIRTFLDFQGLTKPISLQPQTFHVPARRGFTVVEWGGLLRSN